MGNASAGAKVRSFECTVKVGSARYSRLALAFLFGCHNHAHVGAPTGVYVQKHTGHVFNALKFYPRGEVDMSDVHSSVIKGTYKEEGDHVRVSLGQHEIVLKFTSGGCLDGGPEEGVFCTAPRNSK